MARTCCSMEYAIKCEDTNEGTYSTFVPSFVRSVSRIEKNSLHCPDSHVTYSARDAVARVVRPPGVGIAASLGRGRRLSRERGRAACRSTGAVVVETGESVNASYASDDTNQVECTIPSECLIRRYSGFQAGVISPEGKIFRFVRLVAKIFR